MLILFILQVDLFSEDWLRQSAWDPAHETILLIHGYAGGDDTLPITVLRDGKMEPFFFNFLLIFRCSWDEVLDLDKKFIRWFYHATCMGYMIRSTPKLELLSNRLRIHLSRSHKSGKICL